MPLRRSRRIAPAQLLALGAALALPVSGLVFAAASSSSLEAAEAVPISVPAASQAEYEGASLAGTSAPAESGLVETADVETPSDDENFEPVGSGVASYYGRAFAGRRTASGDLFNPTELTAAHRTLPFGSRVKVTNRRNGRTVVVRINDRGPFHGNRVIDLSRAAASEIGLVGPGSGRVELALLTD
jgi:rare lipoprotein A